MGRIVKCPRCQANLEVGNMAPGSSVRCSECGGMARIPSGRTGVNPAVQAPVAAPPPAKKETGTKTRVRAISSTGMRAVRPAPRKSSSTGLVIGLGIALVGVVIVLVVVLAGSKPPPAPPPMPAAKKPAPKVEEPSPPAPVTPAPPDASGPAKTPPPSGRVEEPSKARWDDLMTTLRAGGAFDDLSRPEGVAFKRVKEMGKGAYPHLVKYIEHEDPLLGRAAVAVLNELTGQKKPLPTETTRAKVKAEWEEWIKANP
jgi:hypothetical protein